MGEIILENDDGFAKLRFPIQEVESLFEGGQEYGLRIEFGGTLGKESFFASLLFPFNWETTESNSPIPRSRSTVAFFPADQSALSLGAIFALAFGQTPMQHEFSMPIELDAYSMGVAPIEVRQTEIPLKLFLLDWGEEHYGELYLDVNLPASYIVLAEKDPEYRNAILFALSHPI